MRKLVASIASLMLVLTLWSGLQSSVAYAAEPGGSVTIVASTAPGHSAGDSDEVPADSDKATPHHHNFSHGHEVAVPARNLSTATFATLAPLLNPAAIAPPATFMQHRDLRPPIA